MIIISEILHVSTNKIFVCDGFQLTPNCEEEVIFQNSTEEEILQNEKITFSRDYVLPEQNDEDL